MLNRWTYGWFGQPAPPLPPTSSYQAVHPDAFDPYDTSGRPELDQELAGSWPNSPSPHFDDRTRPIPSNAFARFQSSPMIVPQNQPSPPLGRHARFEQLQDPSTLRPETIPFAAKPSVSPTTLNRLKAQLSTRSTRPVLQSIPRRSRPVDISTGPPWHDPVPLVQDSSTLRVEPHPAPRQTNTGEVYGRRKGDVADEGASQGGTGEAPVEPEGNDHSPEFEVPADFGGQQTQTGSNDPLWSQLPEVAETVLLEVSPVLCLLIELLTLSLTCL